MNIEDIITETKTIIGNGLSVDTLKKAAAYVAKKADGAVPGDDGTAKKTWGKDVLGKVLEQYDNYIPVLGAFMDLPLVDSLEHAGIDSAVEWGYAALKLVENFGSVAPVLDAPELRAAGIE